MLFQRISSGLDFLDAAIGGLYSNRVYLLRGPAQSGRTTMMLQFLMDGLENGENTMMISSDRIENVILKAETMGLSLEGAILENRLILMEYPKEIGASDFQYSHIINLLGEIEQYIQHYHCTRLVFDTIIPLLSNQERTHLVNYIYSLLNSLEELNVTIMVTIGEPNSSIAQKITQLLEDAVVGSFALSSFNTAAGTARQFNVLKMVEPVKPPMSFRVKIEYGVGLTLDQQEPKTALTPAKSQAKCSEISDLALQIAVIGRDEDTIAQVEEIFNPQSQISVFDSQEEFMQQIYHLDFDLLLINAIHPLINWQAVVEAVSEPFPRLPKFIIVDRGNRRFTHQTVRLLGGDGLFFKPIEPGDLIGAFIKVLKQSGSLQELIDKRRISPLAEELPDDFGGLEATAGKGALDAAEPHLISPQAFKENLHRQIWHCRQNRSTLTLVSFKILYTTTFAQKENAPQGLELIKKVAAIVQSSIRGLDDVACRYMDKVVVILDNTDKPGAAAFIRRVVIELKNELAAQMNLIVGRHLNILTAVSAFPDDGDNADELMFQVTDVSRNFVKTAH